MARPHRHPASLHFAFVACNRNAARFREDASYIYRCENMAAGVEAAGHRATLLHLKSLSPLSRFDVVLFHRPRWSPRLWGHLGLLRRRGATVLADFDDLVFDAEFAEFSPGVLNGLVSLPVTRRYFQQAHRALTLFDRISVSTDPLAEHVRACFPQAHVQVVPNAVHHSWRKEKGKKASPDLSRPLITYFPGTRSHDRDFDTIAKTLSDFLRRHPQVRLQVTGPLEFELGARPGQVNRLEKVPYEQFHSLFQEGCVNLAPLEWTPFNRCKSALKVMEAGYWEMPTVCTPIPDALRFEGAGAVFAETAQEWSDRLESLLQPERYRAETDGLRDRVLKSASVEKSASILLNFLGADGGARA